MSVDQELARLEQLSDFQLVKVLEALDSDPAPQSIKTMIVNKVNSIMNERLSNE